MEQFQEILQELIDQKLIRREFTSRGRSSKFFYVEGF